MTTPERPDREAVVAARAARKARREAERERQRQAAEERQPRVVRMWLDVIRHNADARGFTATGTRQDEGDEVRVEARTKDGRTVATLALYADGSGSLSVLRGGETVQAFSWPLES